MYVSKNLVHQIMFFKITYLLHQIWHGQFESNQQTSMVLGQKSPGQSSYNAGEISVLLDKQF